MNTKLSTMKHEMVLTAAVKAPQGSMALQSTLREIQWLWLIITPIPWYISLCTFLNLLTSVLKLRNTHIVGAHTEPEPHMNHIMYK